MYSPEVQSKIEQYRQKAAIGTLPLEEYREAIKLLRGERSTATFSAAGKSRKKAGPVRPVSDMLSELTGL